jgi:hypothetical protein
VHARVDLVDGQELGLDALIVLVEEVGELGRGSRRLVVRVEKGQAERVDERGQLEVVVLVEQVVAVVDLLLK